MGQLGVGFIDVWRLHQHWAIVAIIYMAHESLNSYRDSVRYISIPAVNVLIFFDILIKIRNVTL